MDALGVLLGDLVRDGGQVGDVTTDEEIGVEVGKLDLLRQVCPIANPRVISDRLQHALVSRRPRTYTCGKA